MSGTKKQCYWDACVLMAWLLDEQRDDPLEMEGIAEQIRRVESGEAQCVTSALTLTEMFDLGPSEEAAKKLADLFKRQNFHLVDLTADIAKLSAEIRAFYKAESIQGNVPPMDAPDAIHLATGIYMECDSFFTFDGTGKRKNRSRKSRALLGLGPKVAGAHKLDICKPPGRPQIAAPLKFD